MSIEAKLEAHIRAATAVPHGESVTKSDTFYGGELGRTAMESVFPQCLRAGLDPLLACDQLGHMQLRLRRLPRKGPR